MPKAIVICKEVQSGASKGAPDIGTGYTGFVYIGPLVANYAAYVITGSGAQLTTIDGHANTIGGLLVTGNGVRWSQLDVAVPAALRTKINVYRANNSLGPIGAGVTLLQVAKFAAAAFEYGTHDVWDGA